VRVSGLDTGPGIAPEDQQRIFEKFEQLEGGHTRRHAGTGLGLAIAKELTQMLQGEIQVESEVGRGAMFSVILPVTMDSERAAEMRAEAAFRGRLAAKKN
jgi:signal transduction histidine kinase